MQLEDIFENIRIALNVAPRNQFTAELHLQMLKYADDLKSKQSRSSVTVLVLKKALELSLAR
ncbi:Uncharacterised protein [Shewanella baltica]|nr:Uncharacterised protein [Shewanella baltica]